MIIFVHFYFPFSAHCYIIIYNNKEIDIPIKELYIIIRIDKNVM